jgi:hypothetical protein
MTERLVIEGSTISNTLDELEKSTKEKIKISDIVNFGLTVVGVGEKDFNKEISKIGRTEFIKLNHQFIHLTF